MPKRSSDAVSGRRLPTAKRRNRCCQGKLADGKDCPKGARGKTNFCITHGGGKRCQGKLADGKDCPKSALGKTNFCSTHGGGKRCQGKLADGKDCPKSARGKTDFCITHGGGKRCQGKLADGKDCPNGALGKTNFCTTHGGGKRCQGKLADGKDCPNGAVGKTNFCITHGGGKLCQGKLADGKDCPNGALGKTDFCSTHGGGKRCQGKLADGKDCPNGAVGKTNFCITHGGGKLCQGKLVDGKDCPKSARGKTGFCKTHGGGKRCQGKLADGEDCPTAAYDKSGFCAIHGGGKCEHDKYTRRCLDCMSADEALARELVCITCWQKSSTLHCNVCQPGISWSDEFTLDMIVRNATGIPFQRHVTLSGTKCDAGVLTESGKGKRAHPDLSLKMSDRVVFACADESSGHDTPSYPEVCELARLQVLAYGTNSGDLPHLIVRFNTDRIRSNVHLFAQAIRNAMVMPLPDVGPFVQYVDYPEDNPHMARARAVDGKALVVLGNITELDIDGDLQDMTLADLTRLPLDAVVLSAETLLKKPLCRRYVGKQVCQRDVTEEGSQFCDRCVKKIKTREKVYILTSQGRTEIKLSD